MAAKKKTPSKKKPAPKKKPAAKPAKKAAAAKKTASKPAGKKSASKGAPKKGKRPVRTAKRPSPRRKVVAKKPKVARPQRPSAPASPEAFALAKTIATVAADKKAEKIVVIDTSSRSSAVGYDYLVLATGESDRQLTAIQEGVEDLLKPQGKRPASVEASADWVCVTWDDGVLAHFFTEDRREQMDLEGLWKDAPRVTV